MTGRGLALDHPEPAFVERVVSERLCDPEIQQLHAAGSQTHDVRRGHVAMNDVHALAVDLGQAVRVTKPQRDLVSDERRQRRRTDLLPRVQLANHGREVSTVQILHGQEIHPVDAAEVVNLDDVRVIKQ